MAFARRPSFWILKPDEGAVVIAFTVAPQALLIMEDRSVNFNIEVNKISIDQIFGDTQSKN